jgi:DNA-directed RNA polymerase subunit RPC12/RpoP
MNLKKRLEAEKKVIKGKKYKCYRCNAIFNTNKELQSHRSGLHGEFEVNDKLRKGNNKKSKLKAYPDKSIIRYKGKKYVYILGIGLHYNDELIADENNRFYKEVIDYVSTNDNCCEYIDKKLIKPLSETTKCLNCGLTIKYISKDSFKDEFPLLLCPKCNCNIFKDNRARILNQMKSKNMTPKQYQKWSCGVDVTKFIPLDNNVKIDVNSLVKHRRLI